MSLFVRHICHDDNNENNMPDRRKVQAGVGAGRRGRGGGGVKKGRDTPEIDSIAQRVLDRNKKKKKPSCASRLTIERKWEVY